MRKLIFIVILIVLMVGLGGGGYWLYRGSAPKGSFRTETVSRGNLLASISATGTLEPEDIVDVGAQVAGQLKEFGIDKKTGKPIDYGSEVETGDVLVQIDEQLFKAKVDQSKALLDQAKAQADQAVAKIDDAKANVTVTEANLQVARSKFDQADRDWSRAQAIGRGAMAQADYDGFRSAYDTGKATVAQYVAAVQQAKVMVTEAVAAAATAKATVASAEASLAQDNINLGYTTIKAPVKGVIIDRRVTLGQTVQSSFNTPSLFLLARDLKRMKVWANVNEADVGQVRVGQNVKFTVDAFPNKTFNGTVSLIRLNATMTNNVVTYTVEVLTDNSSGVLLPYLTANLRFEIEKRENVLLVSNEALRWSPSPQQVAPEARADFAKTMQRKDAAAESPKDGQSAGAPESHRRGTVWVQAGNFVKPVKVKLGLSDGTRTEILDGGVEEGAVVVTGDAALQTAAPDGGSNPFAPQLFGGKKKE
jgi:HlyD family secretion protein